MINIIQKDVEITPRTITKSESLLPNAYNL